MVSRLRSLRAEVAKIPEEEAEDVSFPAVLSWPESIQRAACRDASDSLQEGAAAVCATMLCDHFTALNWGGRHDNEDRPVYARDVLGQRHMPFNIVGVLDGHDTAEASDMVSKSLPGTLAPKLKEGRSVPEAYKATMEELEEKLKKHSPHPSAGTCVINCLHAGRHVWCANLGDCRAALIHLQPLPPLQAKGQASVERSKGESVPSKSPRGPTNSVSGRSSSIKREQKRDSTSTPAPQKAHASRLTWMSRDHKASCPHERERIREAGGMVHDGRVEGLEPSRTLGDFDVKGQVRKNVISIVPEVRRHMIGDGEKPAQAVLVCATDGVWDVLTGQDVCNIISARKELGVLQQTLLQECLDGEQTTSCSQSYMKDLAEDLVQFSIAKGSRDDCTAVCAFITVVPR